MKSLVAALIVSTLGLTLGACGKQNAGVTLKSAAFNPTGGASARSNLLATDPSPSSLAVSGVSDFTFCVREVKLEAEDGTAIKDEDSGSDLLEIRLGLVNPGTGSTAVNWGSANLPAGTPLKRVKVEIHHDKELCGVEYSMKINGQTVTKDIELSFAFPAGTEIKDGESITFDLAPIVSQLKAAYDAGAFTNELLGHYLEGTEGNASHE